MTTDTLKIKQHTTTGSSASEATVSVLPNFGIYGTQRLERTFGKQAAALGDGARRAVRELGDALEKLAE